MTRYTLTRVSQPLQPKQISAIRLATGCLATIAAQNPAINGYITLGQDKTFAEARTANACIAQDNTTAPTDVSIAYKNVFYQIDWCSAYGFKMLSNFVSPHTATTVQSLLNEGMITPGHTSMDGLTMGLTDETSFYGATKNPRDPKHIPDGSSGSSATVAAAHLVPAIFGSGTSGSTRQPASHCGTTGVRPTYGTVFRFGIVTCTSSLDQAGPMVQITEDCAILLNVTASSDERDSISLERSKEDYIRDLDRSLRGMKIGLPREYFDEGASTDVQAVLQDVINLSKARGTETIEVPLPQTALSTSAYYVPTSVKVSINLSRYDGVRYGHRATQPSDLEEMYSNTRAEGFGSEVKRYIMIDTCVLSRGYYDVCCLKAQKLRRLVANNFQTAFARCDFILTPTALTVAPKLGSDIYDPVQIYLSGIYIIIVNLAGLPALTLSAGLDGNELPISIQFVGNYFSGAKTPGATHRMQLRSDWYTKAPDGKT